MILPLQRGPVFRISNSLWDKSALMVEWIVSGIPSPNAVAEVIPNRWLLAADVPCTFDLSRCCCTTPQEGRIVAECINQRLLIVRNLGRRWYKQQCLGDDQPHQHDTA